MTDTIQQTIDTLRETLLSYIEATYHIGDPNVVEQRRLLLEQAGGVFQKPYLESTPRYETGKTFAQMTDIPDAAREAFVHLAGTGEGKPLVFDPPYSHQNEAIQTILGDRKNLMIMTGTGSGKTESFLLPIMGKLAIEAKEHPERFKDQHAVRAMILYPMNALVNDQLGRLRTLFGDPHVVEMFKNWSGRPARFARYTSRTPYAGVRTKNKDQTRLKSIDSFFVEMEKASHRYQTGTSDNPEEDHRAHDLKQKLTAMGKWPAKPSVSEWYGSGAWMPNGVRKRAVTMPDDAELMTRDEVQVRAPDLLITNYSMLEYMMMRPIERPIFDQTGQWLADNPDEKFLIVLDEAHLYRGAQGAEVGLLLRRLRNRLGVSEDRFQVVCATASFSDEGKRDAGKFGEELSGVAASSFVPVTGSLKLNHGSVKGVQADLDVLAAINLEAFYSDDDDNRLVSIQSFLQHRNVVSEGKLGTDLHKALLGYGPFSLLVNQTMSDARSFEEVREILFGDVDPQKGDRAVNALIAMGSRARLRDGDASLLPCRVHAFYRGLPGLWACMDPECTEHEDEGKSPIGKLYAQPRERCDCGARVLEYFTCRYCGTSYTRGYVQDLTQPEHVFAQPGKMLRTSQGITTEFEALDILLEAPSDLSKGRPVNYDLVSGLINPDKLGSRTRMVYLKPQAGGLSIVPTGSEDEQEDDGPDDGSAGNGLGQFVPCGCCGRSMGGKSSVQDHVTKGDQPFQALVSAQIKVQPPNPSEATEFAPLRGRKVLVFSDSRQVAARLAPALQVFSLRDTLRALLPLGYQMLKQDPSFSSALTLDTSWIAVVVAAQRLGVRLRPELMGSEVMPRMADTTMGQPPQTAALFGLMQQKPPSNLTHAVSGILRDKLLGLEPLAIASIVESTTLSNQIETLPSIPGLAEVPSDKIDLARAWLRVWSRQQGIWFRDMPDSWWGPGQLVRSHKGDFPAMKHILSTPSRKSAFKKAWIPRLLQIFTESTTAGHRLVARHLSLEIGGNWARCSRCTSVHRPISAVSCCIDCGSTDVQVFDPGTDLVFKARKGFYRDPVIDALESEVPTLMSIIAGEHTAQLNAARADTAFSPAEHHEMQFQDIDLAWRDLDRHSDTSIDVLSSTTTMEVGIDIGDLSGVALRNMPPGRANYQQRSGRAGRRGNAVATVISFGSSDSHDDHYFSRPQEMIRGQVLDPRLTLENPDIARRHIRAFILQRYHEDRLPGTDAAGPGMANLFSVLGTVEDFLSDGHLNRRDLIAWLNRERDVLRDTIDGWLPSQLSPQDRTNLLRGFVGDLTGAMDEALYGHHPNDAVHPVPDELIESDPNDQSDVDEEPQSESDPLLGNDGNVDAVEGKLLERLLYWGVLPRYAFPTDVAPFYVFSARSTGYRPEMEFTPSQGLNIALSQYAPNKQIWIKGKQYTSKAIYSPFPNERSNAWSTRRMYYECNRCGHAKTDVEYDAAKRNEILTCEACHTAGSFGPAKPWFRPTGFAHPWGKEAPSVPDEPNETAYATRAKLTMAADRMEQGVPVNENIKALATRQHLLVSNSGPDGEGYDYCTKCGRIESAASPEIFLSQPHQVPFPTDKDPVCQGAVSGGIVLGTDFPTDIAFFSLRLGDPFRLPPANDETAAAMRTICEALSKAACRMLDLEVGEILAEYRPALSDAGASGTEVEVFLYDTLAGGAGFSPQLAPRAQELFREALRVLSDCQEHCDSSCYRCLRSFRNRVDHALLDRHVGRQLIEHLLTGNNVPFNAARATSSLRAFVDDFERQYSSDFLITPHFESPLATAPVSLLNRSTNVTRWVDICSPIAPNVGVLGTAQSTTLLVDELRVRMHLGGEVERLREFWRQSID